MTTTDYSDTTIAADQTYYYVVHAKTGATEGAASEEAQITPTPWKHVDIGALGAPGNAVFSGGTLRVTASGADIWDTRDEFHFVYRRVSGDCRLVVRVDSVSNSDPWAKAGVMIRRTLLADSQHAMVVVTPGNGVSFQYRSEAGGNMRDVTSGSIRTPRWLSIRRQGNQIVAEQSANGVTWSVIGSQTIAMGEDVYIGIAVTSHNDGTLCEAVISNIQLTGNEPGARNAADAWWLYQ